MEVKQIHRVLEDGYEDRAWLEISIDGEEIFSIGSGEPEDMSLGRDLKSAWNVLPMMRLAYQAGKNGEPFTVTETKTNELE